MGEPATILIIDDDASIRIIAKRALEGFGYVVVVADDGEAGLRTLRSHEGRVNGVLLDLTMPGMSGEDTLRAITTDSTKVPVVVMSGHEELSIESYRAEGLVAGFLHKPFTLENLREAVEEALAEELGRP